MFDNLDISVKMAIIFGIICFVLVLIAQTLSLKASKNPGNWLPLPEVNQIKLDFESYALKYTAIWIAIFGFVVVSKSYESFDEWSYMKLCVSLSLPFLLQPILWPLKSEKNFPLTERYSFKANVWIAIFSFIGNYWYTHYFYSVLKAKYTFPAHRLNDVVSFSIITYFYLIL